MPKLFTLDDYRDCLLHPSGLYCVIDVELKTTTPTDLWYQIKVSIFIKLNNNG